MKKEPQIEIPEKAKTDFTHYLDLSAKIIGIASSVLIFLGIISNVIYYKTFSINILDYVSLGEVLLLFVSNFSLLIIGAVLGFLISEIYTYKRFKQIEEELLRKAKNSSTKETVVKKRKPPILSNTFLIGPLIIAAMLGFPATSLLLILLSFAIKIITCFLVVRKLEDYYQERFKKKLSPYVLLIGVFLSIVATSAMIRAYLAYRNYDNPKISLTKEDGTKIQSDSAKVYLGKSNSHYFFYDKANSTAIIIKSDLIEKVEITK